MASLRPADLLDGAFNAINVLMEAETRKGPFRFLNEAADYLPILADWCEFPDEELDPLDRAISMAVTHAYAVEDETAARRWKAARQALEAVRDCQEIYKVRLHIEDFKPILGYIIKGDVVQGEPLILVYVATDPDLFLFSLPPTSSQELVEAAVTAWRAGFRQGAEQALQAIRGTIAYVEGAV